MLQIADSQGEKLNMGAAKSQIQREFSDFDERNYGYSLFRKFIEEETKFTVKISGSTAYIVRQNQNLKTNDNDNVEKYVLDKAKSKIELAVLGSELRNKYPNFKYKEQGYSKFSKYVQSIKGIKLSTKNNKTIVELDK